MSRGTETAVQPRMLRPTRCAICGTMNEADELYPATLDVGGLASNHYSARRLPDGVHHRIVRCHHCGLVRSDPVLDESAMADLYRASSFDYGDELEGLKATYGAVLDELAALAPAKNSLLDIGCGNGFVLSLALDRGWRDVRGVEPSTDAIARSPRDVAPLIVQDVMGPGLFAEGALDAVTLFQVLDHMSDPDDLLAECHRILRPRGVVLAFNHNVTAWSARLLGERSPIIDVEHTFLYSPTTMQALFERSGFEVLALKPATNTYSATYILHLLPLPTGVKSAGMYALKRSGLGRVQLKLPLGNVLLIARRRA